MKRLGWLLFALGLLVLVICAGITPPFEAAFHLVVGWMPFLIRVLPQIRVSSSGVATAIACLAVTIILTHVFARWLWRSTQPSDGARPWRLRWTLCGVGVIVLMFVAGIGATGVGHQAAWLVRSEEPLVEYRSRERVNRIRCASNLKQIGLALQLYSEKNGGRLPDSMFDVLLHEDMTPEVFCCPSALEERAPGATPQEQIRNLQFGRHNSYVYHGRGLTFPQADHVPILCEPLGNHSGDGMNILFGDGHVELMDAAAAVEALKNLPTVRRVEPTTAPGV